MNYKPIEKRHVINMADGDTMEAVDMGDVEIDLPYGSKNTTVILQEVIYASELAFTLISIIQLDVVKCRVLFKNGMCTISYPNSKTMATLPLSNGIYRIVAVQGHRH